MAIIQRIFSSSDAPARAEHDDFWFARIAGTTGSGIAVSSESAMRQTAVFACLRILAESVAALPLIIYRRRKSGGRDRATDHPLHEVLHASPNRIQTSFEFRDYMQSMVVTRGRAYAQIVPGARGAIDSLIPIHADKVTPRARTDGRLEYVVTTSQGSQVFQDHELMKLIGFTLDGINGISMIEFHRETIGGAMAVSDHGNRFFSNAATPGGVLTMPGHFETPEKRREFAEQWRRATTGANAHKTAVLEDGVKFEPISISNKDSQYIELKKYTAADIARIFRVPPHMIGDLEKATFSNIEHQSLEFVIHTLRPWLVRWEQVISRDLLYDDNFYAEFLIDGLLRGDQKSRYEAYSKGITDGWLTRNEVRELENLNPLPGLSEPIRSANTLPVIGDDDKQSRAAARIARKEAIDLSEQYEAAGSRDEFLARCVDYYPKHRRAIREALPISFAAVNAYCIESMQELKAAADIPAMLTESWEQARAARLIELTKTRATA